MQSNLHQECLQQNPISQNLKLIINSNILKQNSKFKLVTFIDFDQDEENWKQYQEMIDMIKRKGVTSLKVTIDKNELNNENDNSSTNIFKAFEVINNREVIIKIPKKPVDQLDIINNQEISDAEELATKRFYTSSYACQVAYYFNQRLKKSNLLNEMAPLFYAHPILYNLDTPFYGMKRIYGEIYIQIQYKFEKYTQNGVYIESDKYFFSAFSHFSFEVSQGNLVIMDLQGSHNILTHPSIQTNQFWTSILDENETNRKNKGIEDFKFIQHKECSVLCKKLNLDQKLIKIHRLIKMFVHKNQQKIYLEYVIIVMSLLALK